MASPIRGDDYGGGEEGADSGGDGIVGMGGALSVRLCAWLPYGLRVVVVVGCSGASCELERLERAEFVWQVSALFLLCLYLISLFFWVSFRNQSVTKQNQFACRSGLPSRAMKQTKPSQAKQRA